MNDSSSVMYYPRIRLLEYFIAIIAIEPTKRKCLDARIEANLMWMFCVFMYYLFSIILKLWM